MPVSAYSPQVNCDHADTVRKIEFQMRDNNRKNDFMKTHSLNIHCFLPLALVALAGGAILNAAAQTAEDNWPAWRGPLDNGVSPRGNPPVSWSETNNVKWKVKIPGLGLSTPIVWGNRIFIQTAIPTGRKVDAPAEAAPSPPPTNPPSAGTPPGNAPGGPRGGGRGPGMMGGAKPTEFHQFAVLCLDRATGKVMWQQVATEVVPHEGFRAGEGSFVSQSPVTDGAHIFANFGSRGLYAYDLDGKPAWKQTLGELRIKMGFGEGSSAALYQNKLIVNWDHEGASFIIALDKATGQTLWKQPRDEQTSWATPLVIERDGKAQIITAASGKIRSYDMADGKLLWECGGLTANVIPSPVADKERVFCMSGFRGSALLAIKLGGTGDLTSSDSIVWRHNKNTPYVPSPLLYDSKLYFFSVNNGVLSCIDATSGKPLIDAERLEALPGVYASPVGAEGRVYLTGRNGAVVVIKQSDKLEILATNRLDDKFDASPAIAGKELFLRGRQSLYCLGEP